MQERTPERIYNWLNTQLSIARSISTHITAGNQIRYPYHDLPVDYVGFYFIIYLWLFYGLVFFF